MLYRKHPDTSTSLNSVHGQHFYFAKLASIIGIILFLWLALACIWQALTQLPSSDDVMFLSVPKNWLNGYGWATSYSTAIPFNPDLTAGPTLLLPAALLMQLFGNTYWIGNVTGSVINLSLIALCMIQMRKQWPHASIMTLTFITLCIGIKVDDISSLIGYYTVSLLFLLSILLAFNRNISVITRAGLLSLLAALAMNTKPLAAPVIVCFFLLFLIFHWRIISKTTHAHPIDLQQPSNLQLLSHLQQWLGITAGLLLPFMLIQLAWWMFQSHGLASYSTEFLQARTHYGDTFFLHHGSGFHEWQIATNKLQHIINNSNRNLFHLESALAEYHLRNPFLGAELADVNHIVGISWIGLMVFITAMSGWQAWKKLQPLDWVIFALGISSLGYLGWFLGLAMAMSAGHAYFPVQWSLWLVGFFSVKQLVHYLPNKITASVIGLLCFFIISFSSLTAKHYLLFSNAATLNLPEPTQQAKQYIEQTQFRFPLVGCGYNSYPRYLEYLLPNSQNFQDCYDLIEDNVTLDEAEYISANHLNTLTNSTTNNALEHFYQHIGQPNLHYHFSWNKPVNFTLVVSLSTLGNNLRFAPIIEACSKQVLYRNDDVFIMECRFDELQKSIDLDFMMSEIAINQRWYRTRLMPYDGKLFSVFAN